LGINIQKTGERLMFSDKRFGLSSSLIAATRGILGEEKEDKDKVDPKMMKGGKTKVELEPKTDDDTRDYDDKKKSVKEGKEHTVPKTDKEKKLAALAHPKDKITHKDVLVGRGVIAKEEVDLESLTEEDLEEALKKSQPAGEWIKDFVDSKDPKFAGKSKKKRMQMALGAYYAKQRNEEIEIEEATKSATYNSLMADPMKNRLERLKQKEKSMPQGISADRKKLAIDKDKIQKQLAKKQRNEEVELSDEELERLEAIAQSLDEAKPTIVSAPIRGANQDQSGENTKSTSTDYTISDSKKMKKEEVELDEAKRGRPKKNPTPDDEQEEHEHVIMQLRKVVSTHGALPVKHLDGKSTKITPQLAQHALNKHSAMKTAAEKQDFESKMHKSHDSMKSALGQ
jgi:hypothetical protein